MLSSMDETPFESKELADLVTQTRKEKDMHKQIVNEMILFVKLFTLFVFLKINLQVRESC